jgi:activator of HSP90 ATPase
MVYPATINKVNRKNKVGLIVDIKRDIQQRIGDELADEGLVDVPIEYHMTSIFDHSIFEAFSKIIQKLIPQLHTLQDLLNNLVDVFFTETSSDLDDGYT